MKIEQIIQEYIEDSTTKESSLTDEAIEKVRSITQIDELETYMKDKKQYWLSEMCKWDHPFYGTLATPACNALKKIDQLNT